MIGFSFNIRCILLSAAFSLLSGIGKCQVGISGQWQTIASYELVTGSFEDKDELQRNCTGSSVTINKHSIKFSPAKACYLSNSDSFNVISTARLNCIQIRNRFDFNEDEIKTFFPELKKKDLEVLTTNYLERGSRLDPMAIFIINEKKIAIYSEPIFIILNKANK